MSPNSIWERSYGWLKFVKNGEFYGFDQAKSVWICKNVQTHCTRCASFFISKKIEFSKILQNLLIKKYLMCRKNTQIHVGQSWMKISWFSNWSTRFRHLQIGKYLPKSGGATPKSWYFQQRVSKIDLNIFPTHQIVFYHWISQGFGKQHFFRYEKTLTTVTIRIWKYESQEHSTLVRSGDPGHQMDPNNLTDSLVCISLI